MEHPLLHHQRAVLRAHRPQEVIQGGFGVPRPAELQGAQLGATAPLQRDGRQRGARFTRAYSHRCVPLHHGDGALPRAAGREGASSERRLLRPQGTGSISCTKTQTKPNASDSAIFHATAAGGGDESSEHPGPATLPRPLCFPISWNYFAIGHSRTDARWSRGGGWGGRVGARRGGGGGSSFASGEVEDSLGVALVLRQPPAQRGGGCPRLCWALLRFRAWGGGQLLAPSPAHFPLPSHPPSPKQAGGKEGSGVAAPSLCLAQGLGCRNVRLFPLPTSPPPDTVYFFLSSLNQAINTAIRLGQLQGSVLCSRHSRARAVPRPHRCATHTKP